jgi:hypothetical protein
VEKICKRYGIPYNKGPLLRQFGTVVRKIVKLGIPGKRTAEPVTLELVAA